MLNRHLFVYGTLMAAASGCLGATQRRRLAGEAKALGSATIEGRLFDLGSYPGLVLPAASVIANEGRPQLVHGEVHELAEAASSLIWLDAYEGISADASEAANAEYARIERTVHLADGRALVAWVYVYLDDIETARWLPDGRWIAR